MARLDVQAMRAAWVEALAAAGVPEGRLQRARRALASQLDAAAAAGLTPSQLRGVPQVSRLPKNRLRDACSRPVHETVHGTWQLRS